MPTSTLVIIISVRALPDIILTKINFFPNSSSNLIMPISVDPLWRILSFHLWALNDQFWTRAKNARGRVCGPPSHTPYPVFQRPEPVEQREFLHCQLLLADRTGRWLQRASETVCIKCEKHYLVSKLLVSEKCVKIVSWNRT